jgi:hypothetical protein
MRAKALRSIAVSMFFGLWEYFYRRCCTSRILCCYCVSRPSQVRVLGCCASYKGSRAFSWLTCARELRIDCTKGPDTGMLRLCGKSGPWSHPTACMIHTIQVLAVKRFHDLLLLWSCDMSILRTSSIPPPRKPTMRPNATNAQTWQTVLVLRPVVIRTTR